MRTAPARLSTLLLAAVTLAAPPASAQSSATRFETLPYAPRAVVVHRAPGALTIDGKLDEPGWRAVPASPPFGDIDGVKPVPLRTTVKMLWDDEYFYVGAEMEEPHVWGTLTARDAVIFQDNDFELFIDPDGDTHNYFELEINALGTVWDLMLPQPYRDGGPAIHAWDIAGLRSAVSVDGTINRTDDRDRGWSVEIAMPWAILREAARGRALPRDGDRWRVNFSRVEWQTDVRDGRYGKRIDPATGKPHAEDNWVWSPQGAINMHMPERWGIVQFSSVPAGQGTVAVVEDRNDRVRWALRRLYYRQAEYRRQHGRYAADLAALGAADVRVEGLDFTPAMQVTDSLYEIAVKGFDDVVLRIRQDGKVW